MESIAVTKPNMAVLGQNRLLVTPFGLLSCAFAQELLARTSGEEGFWPFAPLEFLEEEGEEPRPISGKGQSIQLSVNLTLDWLRREKALTQRQKTTERLLEKVLQMQAQPTQNRTAAPQKGETAPVIQQEISQQNLTQTQNHTHNHTHNHILKQDYTVTVNHWRNGPPVQAGPITEQDPTRTLERERTVQFSQQLQRWREEGRPAPSALKTTEIIPQQGDGKENAAPAGTALTVKTGERVNSPFAGETAELLSQKGRTAASRPMPTAGMSLSEPLVHRTEEGEQEETQRLLETKGVELAAERIRKELTSLAETVKETGAAKSPLPGQTPTAEEPHKIENRRTESGEPRAVRDHRGGQTTPTPAEPAPSKGENLSEPEESKPITMSRPQTERTALTARRQSATGQESIPSVFSPTEGEISRPAAPETAKGTENPTANAPETAKGTENPIANAPEGQRGSTPERRTEQAAPVSSGKLPGEQEGIAVTQPLKAPEPLTGMSGSKAAEHQTIRDIRTGGELTPTLTKEMAEGSPAASPAGQPPVPWMAYPPQELIDRAEPTETPADQSQPRPGEGRRADNFAESRKASSSTEGQRQSPAQREPNRADRQESVSTTNDRRDGNTTAAVTANRKSGETAPSAITNQTSGETAPSTTVSRRDGQPVAPVTASRRSETTAPTATTNRTDNQTTAPTTENRTSGETTPATTANRTQRRSVSGTEPTETEKSLAPKGETESAQAAKATSHSVPTEGEKQNIYTHTTETVPAQGSIPAEGKSSVGQGKTIQESHGGQTPSLSQRNIPERQESSTPEDRTEQLGPALFENLPKGQEGIAITQPLKAPEPLTGVIQGNAPERQTIRDIRTGGELAPNLTPETTEGMAVLPTAGQPPTQWMAYPPQELIDRAEPTEAPATQSQPRPGEGQRANERRDSNPTPAITTNRAEGRPVAPATASRRSETTAPTATTNRAEGRPVAPATASRRSETTTPAATTNWIDNQTTTPATASRRSETIAPTAATNRTDNQTPAPVAASQSQRDSIGRTEPTETGKALVSKGETETAQSAKATSHSVPTEGEKQNAHSHTTETVPAQGSTSVEGKASVGQENPIQKSHGEQTSSLSQRNIPERLEGNTPENRTEQAAPASSGNLLTGQEGIAITQPLKAPEPLTGISQGKSAERQTIRDIRTGGEFPPTLISEMTETEGTATASTAGQPPTQWMAYPPQELIDRTEPTEAPAMQSQPRPGEGQRADDRRDGNRTPTTASQRNGNAAPTVATNRADRQPTAPATASRGSETTAPTAATNRTEGRPVAPVTASRGSEITASTATTNRTDNQTPAPVSTSQSRRDSIGRAEPTATEKSLAHKGETESAQSAKATSHSVPTKGEKQNTHPHTTETVPAQGSTFVEGKSSVGQEKPIKESYGGQTSHISQKDILERQGSSTPENRTEQLSPASSGNLLRGQEGIAITQPLKAPEPLTGISQGKSAERQTIRDIRTGGDLTPTLTPETAEGMSVSPTAGQPSTQWMAYPPQELIDRTEPTETSATQSQPRPEKGQRANERRDSDHTPATANQTSGKSAPTATTNRTDNQPTAPAPANQKSGKSAPAATTNRTDNQTTAPAPANQKSGKSAPVTTINRTENQTPPSVTASPKSETTATASRTGNATSSAAGAQGKSRVASTAASQREPGTAFGAAAQGKNGPTPTIPSQTRQGTATQGGIPRSGTLSPENIRQRMGQPHLLSPHLIEGGGRTALIGIPGMGEAEQKTLSSLYPQRGGWGVEGELQFRTPDEPQTGETSEQRGTTPTQPSTSRQQGDSPRKSQESGTGEGHTRPAVVPDLHGGETAQSRADLAAGTNPSGRATPSVGELPTARAGEALSVTHPITNTAITNPTMTTAPMTTLPSFPSGTGAEGGREGQPSFLSYGNLPAGVQMEHRVDSIPIEAIPPERRGSVSPARMEHRMDAASTEKIASDGTSGGQTAHSASHTTPASVRGGKAAEPTAPSASTGTGGQPHSISQNSRRTTPMTHPLMGRTAAPLGTIRTPGQRGSLSRYNAPASMQGRKSIRSSAPGEPFPGTEMTYLSQETGAVAPVSGNRPAGIIQQTTASQREGEPGYYPGGETYLPDPVELAFPQPPQETPSPAPERTEERTQDGMNSDYVRSLPDWAQRFLNRTPGESIAGTKPMQTTVGELSAPAPQEEQVSWTAPNFRPPAQLSLREKTEKTEEKRTEEVRISDAEIRRMSDQVYRMIEDRLRWERRRLGL